MTPKEKRDAKNARHKRNEQRRRKRWLDRMCRMWCPSLVPDRDKQA